MEKGDSIAYGEIWENYCDKIGYPGTQNHLLLPWPGDTTRAMMLYLIIEPNGSTYHLLYATLRFDDTHPLGIVEEKDIYILNPGSTALLTAVRHANGRDWWIILPENKTNRYYSFLLEPGGLTLAEIQTIGMPWEEREWASQAIFTPDGKRYVRFNPWKGLDIFDFDRCSGQLSNPLESGPFTDPPIIGGGVAASMDSRYLYISNITDLFQFDLRSPDILASKTLIDTYDGFEDPFPTTFYHMALAPDGKIYVFANNAVKSLHVIHHPERYAVGCEFTQHSFKTPTYLDIGGINFPYFRLGPEDNSICDTLGIDNFPVAFFRYEKDSLVPLQIYVTNLSYFMPDKYAWSFGNGEESNDKDPSAIHYNLPDIYQICLTVQNEFGQDTYCTDVDLRDTISHIEETSDSRMIHLIPNPFSTFVTISGLESGHSCQVQLFSLDSREVLRITLPSYSRSLDTSSLIPGVYTYVITNGDGLKTVGRVCKLR